MWSAAISWQDAAAGVGSDVAACIRYLELPYLMIDHGVGVTLEEAYEIKRVDSDYFNEA